MNIMKSFGGVYYGIYYIDSPICEIGDSGYCMCDISSYMRSSSFRLFGGGF